MKKSLIVASILAVALAGCAARYSSPIAAITAWSCSAVFRVIVTGNICVTSFAVVKKVERGVIYQVINICATII